MVGVKNGPEKGLQGLKDEYWQSARGTSGGLPGGGITVGFGRRSRQGWGSGQNSGLRVQRPRSARLCDVKYIILPLSLQKWGLKCPEVDLNKAHRFSCRYRCTSQTLQVQFQTVAINQNAAREQVAFFFFGFPEHMKVMFTLFCCLWVSQVAER